MEIIKVGIYVDDRRFAIALAKGLARESRTMMFHLLDDLLNSNDFDMILTLDESNDRKAVQLVMDSYDGNADAAPPYRIFRYQKCDAMVNDLLFIYFKMTGRVLEYRRNGTCSLVALCSDAGGAGTTSISISLGKLLYKLYGRKCLYLNACPIDGSGKYLETVSTAGFLKLLYYLDSGRDFPLRTFISQRDDLDYIHTGTMNIYFDDVKSVIMNNLLEKIDQLGSYHYLLLDMGNHYGRESRKILENVDVLLQIHDDQGKMPASYIDAIWNEVEKKAATSRRIWIHNFADVYSEGKEDHRYITADVHAFTLKDEGEICIDLSKNYGLEIGEIAKRIVEGDRNDRDQ